MRDHTKLKAFELADRLALAVYRYTQCFPQGGDVRSHRAATTCCRVDPVEHRRGMRSPLRADYLRFLDVAYASSREVEYQLSLAARLGYLEAEAHREVSGLCVETSKVIAGLLRALRQ